MSYIFYCFLTMRGRPFVVVDFWVSPMIAMLLFQTCHCFSLVNCMLPFNTCISLGNCIITWPLTCHYLARPLCCTMTYPDYYQSHVMIGCLLISPSYHAITLYPAWYTWLVIVIFTGIWLVILYHDQWLVFLLYMQWPDYILFMYSWFLIMSISYFPRKLIIT